ncbi:MAG: protein translocase subunit SecD [bacterium]
MNRQWKFKGLLAVGLLIVAVLMLVPTLVGPTPKGEEPKLPGWFTGIFANRLILGLDLQGGIHLQYQVDVPDALRRRATQTAGNLESLLKSERNVEVKATPGSGESLDEITTVAVAFPAAEDTAKLDVEFVAKNLPEYEIGGVDGTTVTLVMKADAITSFQEDAVEKAIDTIERRINAFGVAESTISRRGDNELVVQLPGLTEEEFGEAKKKLAQTGQLRFQIVDRAGAADFAQKIGARRPLPDNWPADLDPELKKHKIAVTGGTVRSTSRAILEYMVDGQFDAEHLVGYEEIFADPKDPTLGAINTLSEEQEKILRKRKTDDLEGDIVRAYEVHYLFSKAGMSGENVEAASVGYDNFNRPVVLMRFSQVDADKFFEMTKKYTKELMAILIDDQVYSAPRIKEPIAGGRVQIEMGAVGRTAFKEASALVAVLKSGALQAPLRKLYDAQVGATLGADSVRAGQLSVAVGFGLVVLFMLVYYKGSGVVANLALILNVVFVMAGLTAFGATLTLPGIAGIVLTIGMAVDANVLIFERVREELRLGVSVRKAIDAGYEKAFSAILDANVTTGIAAVVLYQFGSGPIRGFAVTLGVGIICSLYTALVVTRLVFDYKYRADAARMSI